MATAEDGRFYARVFWLVAAALLGLLLLNILKPFLESILWAGLLAFLLAPVSGFLTRGLGGRPALAASRVDGENLWLWLSFAIRAGAHRGD